MCQRDRLLKFAVFADQSVNLVDEVEWNIDQSEWLFLLVDSGKELRYRRFGGADSDGLGGLFLRGAATVQ